MPIESVLPAVFPEWALGDTGWPPVQSACTLIPNAVSATDEERRLYSASYGTPNSRDMLTLLTGGAGFLRPNWTNHNGVICLQTQGGAFPSAMFVGQNMVFYGPLASGTLTAKVPEPFRVSILELFVSWTVAAPALTTDDKPLVFCPSDGGGVTAIALGGIAGAQYGVRGDGAGGLEFFSSIGGVLQESVALAWPQSADLRYWVKLSAEHIAATPTSSAKFNLYIDDNVVIARNWDGGTTLPAFSDAVAGTGCMMRAAFYQGANVNLMNIAMIRARAGNFDFGGSAV